MRVVDVNRIVDLTGELADLPPGHEAWLVHDKSRHADPQEPDETLLKACGSLGIHCRAQLVLMPPFLDDWAERGMHAGSSGACRMVRLCPGPKGHGYPLVDWVISPLPETCERENVALAIDYQDSGIPWSEVVSFARAYPAVPMIVTGAAVGEDRTIQAALPVAPNLVIELSGLRTGQGLAPLVERFGAHRFVYGSGGRGSETRIPRELAPSVLEALVAGTADAIESGAWRETYL